MPTAPFADSSRKITLCEIKMNGIRAHSDPPLRRAHAVGAVALAFLLTAGCVQTKMSIAAQSAAKTNALDGVNKLAVMPFDNDDKGVVTAYLESQLFDAKASGLTAVTLVDRHSIDKIKNELRLGRDGGIDEAKAKKIGRLLGADALLVGRVLPGNVTKNTSSHQATECTAYENSNKLFKKCISTGIKTVTCTTLVATVSIQPRVIRVTTGEVAYTKVQNGQASHEYCDNGGTAVDERVLQSNALANALREVRADLAPYRYVIDAPLKQSADGLTGASREAFEGALAFARTGRFDRACSQFTQLEAEGARTIAVRYNIALCDEASGRLFEARRRIVEIDGDLRTPDPDINLALQRLERRVAEQAGTPGASRSDKPPKKR